MFIYSKLLLLLFILIPASLSLNSSFLSVLAAWYFWREIVWRDQSHTHKNPSVFARCGSFGLSLSQKDVALSEGQVPSTQCREQHGARTVSNKQLRHSHITMKSGTEGCRAGLVHRGVPGLEYCSLSFQSHTPSSQQSCSVPTGTGKKRI